MIIFPRVLLPESFTALLKTNIHNTQDSLDKLNSLLSSSPSVAQLIEHSFLDIDPQKRVSIIVKSLGWRNFRDRLASLYIAHVIDGRFPEVSRTDLVEDLTDFEQKTIQYNVEGYSRNYLLAFYFKFIRLQLYKEGKKDLSIKFNIENDLLDYLKLSKAKSVKIDYIILALFHFNFYLGKGVLLKFERDQPLSYKELFSKLNKDQQLNMMGNILNYSYAIHEPEMFTDYHFN